MPDICWLLFRRNVKHRTCLVPERCQANLFGQAPGNCILSDLEFDRRRCRGASIARQHRDSSTDIRTSANFQTAMSSRLGSAPQYLWIIHRLWLCSTRSDGRPTSAGAFRTSQNSGTHRICGQYHRVPDLLGREDHIFCATCLAAAKPVVVM